jgi:hypothetical protein
MPYSASISIDRAIGTQPWTSQEETDCCVTPNARANTSCDPAARIADCMPESMGVFLKLYNATLPQQGRGCNNLGTPLQNDLTRCTS